MKTLPLLSAAGILVLSLSARAERNYPGPPTLVDYSGYVQSKICQASFGDADQFITKVNALNAQNLTYLEVREKHPDLVNELSALTKQGNAMKLTAPLDTADMVVKAASALAPESPLPTSLSEDLTILQTELGAYNVFIRQTLRNLGTRSSDRVESSYPSLRSLSELETITKRVANELTQYLLTKAPENSSDIALIQANDCK